MNYIYYSLCLLTLLLTSPARAQALLEQGSSSGTGITSSTALSAYSLTLSALSGQVAIQQPSGSYICLDGYTETACISYDVASNSVKSTKPLSAPSVSVTGALSGATLSTTGSASVGSLASTGNISGAGGTFSGFVSAASYSTSGGVNSSALTVSGLANVGSLTSSGASTASSYTATSTSNAVVVPTNGKVCLNGSTCTRAVSSDGTSINVSSALTGTSATWSSTSTATTFTATSTGNSVVVPSGGKACFDGATCAKAISWNGSAFVFSDAVSGTSVTWSGAISGSSVTTSSTGDAVVLVASGKLCFNGAGGSCMTYNTPSGYVIHSGLFQANALRSAGNVDVDQAVMIHAYPLVTCDSTKEGYIMHPTGTGALSSVRMKFCICMGDGSGGYFWRNQIAGTDGTSTTC